MSRGPPPRPPDSDHTRRAAELAEYLDVARSRYGRGKATDHAIASGHIVGAAVALHAHEAGAEAASRQCATAMAEAHAAERRKR